MSIYGLKIVDFKGIGDGGFYRFSLAKVIFYRRKMAAAKRTSAFCIMLCQRIGAPVVGDIIRRERASSKAAWR